MSNKPPLMPHDPLAELDEAEEGQVTEEKQPEVTPEPEQVMSNDVAESTGSAKVVFEESLTIADVGEVYPTLKGHLDSLNPVTLDASGVEVIDTAGIQLLAAFIKEADEHSIKIEWDGVSEVLKKAADRIALNKELHLPEAS